MKDSGYYEIKNNPAYEVGIKALALAGNVEFNRLHWHEHLEILCCIYGSFCVRVDGEVFRLSEGDIITINGGASHEIFDGRKNGLQIIFSVYPSLLKKDKDEIYDFSTVGKSPLKLDSQEVRQVRKSLGRMAWLQTPDIKDIRQKLERFRLKSANEAMKEEVKEEIKEMQLAFQTEEDWNLFHMELYRVLMYLARHKKKEEIVQDVSSPKSQFIECVQILHREYDQPLNVEILAKRIGVGEATIYRMFQKYLGVSFTEYLNSIRINAVCGYLENTSYNITEISGICGFTSLSNFYRVFQIYKGQSPSDYRKEKKNIFGVSKVMQEDIMSMNQFQTFWELPYDRDELL